MNPRLETLTKLVKGFTKLDTTEIPDTIIEPLMDGEGLDESITITAEPGVVDSIKEKLNEFTFF